MLLNLLIQKTPPRSAGVSGTKEGEQESFREFRRPHILLSAGYHVSTFSVLRNVSSPRDPRFHLARISWSGTCDTHGALKHQRLKLPSANWVKAPQCASRWWSRALHAFLRSDHDYFRVHGMSLHWTIHVSKVLSQ